MARSKRDKRDTDGGDALTHSPFAGLAGADLPPGPEVQETTAEAPPPVGFVRGQKVVVRRQKKGRGGKTVTVIGGLPETRLEELRDRLKRALGCGASVEGVEVVLHGALVERAAEWLEAEGAPRVVRS
jgi:translation initiation factor 1